MTARPRIKAGPQIPPPPGVSVVSGLELLGVGEDVDDGLEEGEVGLGVVVASTGFMLRRTFIPPICQ